MFLASAALNELCWEDLMDKKTVDRHTFGVGYLEVERNIETKEPVGLYHAPAMTIRKCKRQRTKVDVEQKVKNPLTYEWETQPRKKQFRKYAEVTGGAAGQINYFKEFGDPRLMDSRTGMYFDPDIPMEALPEKFRPANEILEYAIYSPMYLYGVPWWIATSIWVLASRAAELVNYFLLKNNAIPPGMLIIEGHKDQKLEQKIKDDLTINMSGEESYSSFLVLSVEAKPTAAAGPGASPPKPSIRFESFSQLLNKEGMFMEYIKMGDEKQVSSFGLANQYVGKNNDLNRATAEVAQDLTEMQVFIPERNSNDAVFNNTILAELGIKYWIYRTKASALQDPELISGITEKAVTNGSITRNEARPILSRILKENLETIPEDWANQPQEVWNKLTDLGDAASPEGEVGSNQIEVEKLVKELGTDFSKRLAFDMIKHFVEMRDDLEVKAMYLYNEANPDGSKLTPVN
jgi:capsid portal protein